MWPYFASHVYVSGFRLEKQLHLRHTAPMAEGKERASIHLKAPLRYGVSISAFIPLTRLNQMAVSHISG